MALRIYTKALVFFTLFLIFVGGMVKSTDSGLAVPDWPLSYGTLFPPMIGGVFYEHGHRMIASFVGLMTLILSVWLWKCDSRRWVKWCGVGVLIAVILQGVLGGLTVIYMLPTMISASHGILAQTFLLLTIFLAYSQSKERKDREVLMKDEEDGLITKTLVLISLIYIQLFLGALVRHTESGLAIFDWPTHAGYFIPPFNQEMLTKINDWRFFNNYDFVTMSQVILHFFHRLGALIIVLYVCYLNYVGLKYKNKVIKNSLWFVSSCVIGQFLLGVLTILTQKAPVITSLHVLCGALFLALSFFLLLRVSPIQWVDFRKKLFS